MGLGNKTLSTLRVSPGLWGLSWSDCNRAGELQILILAHRSTPCNTPAPTN
jgi:hypothetical protein